MKEVFRKLAHHASLIVGSAYAFIVAVSLCAIWAVLGPLFNFSNTWQLVINTSTTIITFLVVFLVQNTQNREAITVQLKLDELLRAVAAARMGMAAIEDLSDAELEALHREFERLAKGTRGEVAITEEAADTGVADRPERQ